MSRTTNSSSRIRDRLREIPVTARKAGRHFDNTQFRRRQPGIGCRGGTSEQGRTEIIPIRGPVQGRTWSAMQSRPTCRAHHGRRALHGLIFLARPAVAGSRRFADTPDSWIEKNGAANFHGWTGNSHGRHRRGDTYRPVVSPPFFNPSRQRKRQPGSFMEIPEHGHEPVLLRQILELIDPKPGEVILDCTTGRGGHAAALAQRIKPNGLLLCLDTDSVNLEYARERLAGLEVKCRFFQANFAELQDVLASAGVKTLDVVLADLGVSTNQLLSEKYGLSFSIDGPLDMRLDPRVKRSAADLIATLPEKELADLIYSLAEERYSRRIARAIVEARRKQPILRTAQLAEIVRSAAGHVPHGRIDAATRTG